MSKEKEQPSRELYNWFKGYMVITGSSFSVWCFCEEMKGCGSESSEKKQQAMYVVHAEARVEGEY